MIEYVKGDVTQAPEFVILQGCNAQGKMNSGVAKAIRKKWPEVFAQYDFEATINGLRLGDIYPCFVRKYYTGYKPYSEVEKVVINGITQQYYGRDPNIVYVNYNAIDRVLLETKDLMIKMGQNTLATVKVGAGLGNGDWNIIEESFNMIFEKMLVKIYVPDL